MGEKMSSNTCVFRPLKIKFLYFQAIQRPDAFWSTRLMSISNYGFRRVDEDANTIVAVSCGKWPTSQNYAANHPRNLLTEHLQR